MRERIQKIISAAGLMSRRAAERYIDAGRVTVNDAAAELGMRADPERDDIRIDGVPIPPPGEKLYIMLNKPCGYITTVNDDRGRKTVMELLDGIGTRLYPVGRLDRDSQGLLLMTNDGDVAKKLTGPSHNVLKTYRVWVKGNTAGGMAALTGSIEIDGRAVTAKAVRLISEKGKEGIIDITIGEGRNRQVRRMCAAAELGVEKLVRIAQGELRLGGLKIGCWRHLSTKEIAYLKNIPG